MFKYRTKVDKKGRISLRKIDREAENIKPGDVVEATIVKAESEQ